MKKDINNNNTKFFSMKLVALLSVALVVSSAPAISANIPAIKESYTNVNPTFIGLLTTIPSLFLILGVFLTTFIERVIGIKNTIILGLLCVSIFGTLPAWGHINFSLLLISRCLLGLGIGLFNRLLIQLISQLYTDDNTKKAKAIGLESAFEGLGGIFMTLLVGQLVSISWRASFLVYSFALVGVIFVSIWIPKSEISNSKTNIKKQNQIINKSTRNKAIFLGSILFVIVTLFINFNLQITPLLIEKGIGGAREGSNMIAGIATGAFVAGNLFGTLYSKLHKWLLPLAVMSAGASIYLTTIVDSTFLILFCSLLLGFSFRNIMPYFMHILTNGSEEMAKLGTTIVLVAYNLGATVSPFTSRLIEILGNNFKASYQMTMIGTLLICLGFILLLFKKTLN